MTYFSNSLSRTLYYWKNINQQFKTKTRVLHDDRKLKIRKKLFFCAFYFIFVFYGLKLIFKFSEVNQKFLNFWIKFVKFSENSEQNHFGLCLLFPLLTKLHSKGPRPCRTMLANSHSFSVNVNHILIRFVFMKDQEKKKESCKQLFGYFSIIPAQISPARLRYGRLAHRI